MRITIRKISFFYWGIRIFHQNSLHLIHDPIQILMKITLKYGLLIVVVYMLLHILLHFTTGTESNIGKSLLLLNYAAYTGAILMGVVEKRKLQNGSITFGSAFGTGFMIMLFAAVLLGIYTYSYYKFINHHSIEAAYKAIDAQIAKKDLPEAQVGTATTVAKLMVSPGGFAVMHFIGWLLVGALISLIMAAFLRKEQLENPIPQHEDIGQYN